MSGAGAASIFGPQSNKWDLRFLQMAKLVSSWSKDPSTKTGAVIVRPNKTIVSAGFNGFPQRMSDYGPWYWDREEKYSRIVHCEINALIFAAKPVRGCTLYTYPFCSCDRCAVQMIQAGISRFVFPTPSADALTRWGPAFAKSKSYFEEAEIPFNEVEETL